VRGSVGGDAFHDGVRDGIFSVFLSSLGGFFYVLLSACCGVFSFGHMAQWLGVVRIGAAFHPCTIRGRPWALLHLSLSLFSVVFPTYSS
jgi:hypothetical protein